MRSAPVISFSSAQRPVSSSPSSHRASRPGRSALWLSRSVCTTSDSVGAGALWPGPGSAGAGHSSATVSDRSPT